MILPTAFVKIFNYASLKLLKFCNISFIHLFIQIYLSIILGPDLKYFFVFSNPWLEEFWEWRFNCHLRPTNSSQTPCSGVKLTDLFAILYNWLNRSNCSISNIVLTFFFERQWTPVYQLQTGPQLEMRLLAIFNPNPSICHSKYFEKVIRSLNL